MAGGHGGGGEYENQVGFGWTNGVIMELLDRYGTRLTAEERFISVVPEASTSRGDSTILGGVVTAALALIVTATAGCIG